MEVYKIRDLMRNGTPVQRIALRVTYYARVSTDREEQASSLENQIAYYTDYIKSNPLWTFVEGYVDEGLSGASTQKRESFHRMIRDGQNGRFDFIITKEISRFSRNTVDSIQFTQLLLRHNVGVLFQNDNINTFDTDGELRLTIMSSLAQDELRRLSERVKFGHRQCIQQGKVLGRDNLYGYHKKNGVLTIQEEQAEIVRLIFNLYAHQQRGVRAISKALYDRGITSSQGNPFNTRTIANMLCNPKYKGFYRGNLTTTIDYRTKKVVPLPASEWVYYKDSRIPAIVSEELWDKAHALFMARSARYKASGARTHNKYAYSGKLFCAEHGTSFFRQLRESGKEVWLCKMYRERGAKACTAPVVYTDEIDKILADIFRSLPKDDASLIDGVIQLIKSAHPRTSYEKTMERIQNDISALHSKKDKLLELSIAGALGREEFKKRNDGYNESLQKLTSALAQCENQKRLAAKTNDQSIRRALTQALDMKDGVPSELAACILDKIMVCNTGDKRHVKLQIHLSDATVVERAYFRGGLAVKRNNP